MSHNKTLHLLQCLAKLTLPNRGPETRGILMQSLGISSGSGTLGNTVTVISEGCFLCVPIIGSYLCADEEMHLNRRPANEYSQQICACLSQSANNIRRL